jgi:hypothetical protein
METHRLMEPDVFRLYLKQDIPEGNQRSLSHCFICTLSLNTVQVPVVPHSMSAVQVVIKALVSY